MLNVLKLPARWLSGLKPLASARCRGRLPELQGSIPAALDNLYHVSSACTL